MSDLHGVLFELADLVTKSLNPIFVALILEEPLLLAQARRLTGKPGSVARATLLFWGRSFFAVGGAVVLAELGKRYQVWPGHPGFPSGHTTLAAAAATCLMLQRGRTWAYLTVPLALLMAVGLVYGRWHTPDEAVAALVLGPTVACTVWRLTTRR